MLFDNSEPDYKRAQVPINVEQKSVTQFSSLLFINLLPSFALFKWGPTDLSKLILSAAKKPKFFRQNEKRNFWFLLLCSAANLSHNNNQLASRSKRYQTKKGRISGGHLLPLTLASFLFNYYYAKERFLFYNLFIFFGNKRADKREGDRKKRRRKLCLFLWNLITQFYGARLLL